MMIISNRELAYLKVQADICEYRKNMLQEQVDSGKMNVTDAADEYEELTKKEKALQEAFVKEAHVRNDGTARIIKHHLPTDKNPRDYWVTILDDGRRMYDASYEAIIEHSN